MLPFSLSSEKKALSQNLQDQLNVSKAAIEKKDATIKEKDATIKEKDAKIKEKDAKIKEQQAIIEDLQKQTKKYRQKVTTV